MGKKFRILIIEDNDRNQRLFKLIFDYLGYESILASDGEEGVEMAKQQQPDLIIMDIQLPKLDGVAALALLRENWQTHIIPVIAVTSFAMQADRDRLLAKGFNAYIAKPIDTEEFTQLIQATLRQHYGNSE